MNSGFVDREHADATCWFSVNIFCFRHIGDIYFIGICPSLLEPFCTDSFATIPLGYRSEEGFYLMEVVLVVHILGKEL